MKRFAVTALAVLGLVPSLAFAQNIVPPGGDAKFDWTTLYMRNSNTTAGTALERRWTLPINSPGFADSTVLRRAVTTLTVYDTTQAIAVANLPFPPQTDNKGGSTALADTAAIQPWISIRVSQDTTSYGYTSNAAFDSVHVGAQWSIDGINWNAVAGTVTVQPSTAFFTSGEDGLAPAGMKGAEFSGPASDVVEIALTCVPNLYTQDPSVLIMNKTLCEAPGYIRFIVGMDGTGQFKVELGRWRVVGTPSVN